MADRNEKCRIQGPFQGFLDQKHLNKLTQVNKLKTNSKII